MAERWWISTSNTSFDNTANWAEANGTGVGGFSVPTSGDNVWFNGSGTADCYFGSFTAFDDFTIQDEYPGRVYDSGYDVYVYGDISIVVANKLTSTSTWYQKVDTSNSVINSTTNRLDKWVMESGVTLNIPSSYFHTKKLTVKEHATVNDSNLRLVLTYPTEDQPLELHPTGQIDSMRYYLNTVDIHQSGWNGNLGSILSGYGGAGGQSIIAESDMNCTGSVQIHGSNGAITEAQVRGLDMNGYNLTCTQLRLGLDVTGYDGYGGKVKFGSGTHNIGFIYCLWKNTYSYIDWGTATVNITGNEGLRLWGLVYSYGSGIINMIGTGAYQEIHGSGYVSANLNIDKSNGPAKLYESVCNYKSVDVTRGDFDFNGHHLQVSGDFRVLESGRLWDGNPDQDGGSLYTAGNTELYGTADDPLYINNLNFGFSSPSVGVAKYVYVKDSSYSGDSYMDATHPTNIGYEGSVSGWRFCDLYYPIETPVGKIMVKRVYGDPLTGG